MVPMAVMVLQQVHEAMVQVVEQMARLTVAMATQEELVTEAAMAAVVVMVTQVALMAMVSVQAVSQK